MSHSHSVVPFAFCRCIWLSHSVVISSYQIRSSHPVVALTSPHPDVAFTSHHINKSSHSVVAFAFGRRIWSSRLVVVSGRHIRSLLLQVITLTTSRRIQSPHLHSVVTSSGLCIRSSHPVAASIRRIYKYSHKQVVTFRCRIHIQQSSHSHSVVAFVRHILSLHLVVVNGRCIQSSN